MRGNRLCWRGVVAELREGTVLVQAGDDQAGNEEEREAGSDWGVLKQNFEDPFDMFASEVLIQVELPRGLSNAQVWSSAMSPGLELDTGESFLEVKNLGAQINDLYPNLDFSVSFNGPK